MIRKRLALRTEPEWIAQTDEEVTISAALQDAGTELLEIDVFYDGELRYRHFIDKAAAVWATYETMLGKWSGKMLSLLLEKNPCYYRYYSWNKKVWASPEYQKLARDYLGDDPEYWEAGNAHNKRIKALYRKQDRIDSLMASLPPFPDDAEDWICREVITKDFLFLKKEEKRQRYFCTACGYKGIRYKNRIRIGRTVCPHCGKEVKAQYYKAGKEERTAVTFLQVVDRDRWAERICTARVLWNDTGKHVHIDSEINIVIDKWHTFGKVYYGQKYLADEFEQEFWTSNPLNKRCGKLGYLYPGDIDTVLRYGQLEHSGLKDIAEKGIRTDINAWILYARSVPVIEYLAKGRYIKLAADIIVTAGRGYMPDYLNQDAETAEEFFGFDGNRRQRLRTIGGGISALLWLREEERRGWKIGTEELKWLDANDIRPGRCEKLIQAGATPNKIAHFLQKQKESPLASINTWEDYIRIAELEGLDITDNIVRFPKKLRQRHNALVNQRNKRDKQEKYSELNRRIIEELPKTKRLYFRDQDYVIIPAGTCEELEAEGKTLHHCVGASTRYMESMAQGRTWILFLRKTEEIEAPYYTIEIDMKDDRIIQFYSEYDRKPDEKEIRKELAKYARHLVNTRAAAG